MSGDLFTTERQHNPSRTTVREIPLAGRRVLRVSAFTLADDDELRFLIWTCWQEDAALPVSSHCVSFPASVLPELREALDALVAEG